MKTYLRFLPFLLLLACKIETQDPYKRTVERYRYAKDSVFRFDGSETPLPPQEQRWFVSLNYFTPDSTYRTLATIEFLDTPRFTLIRNSQNLNEEYYKVGYLHFTLQKHACTLAIYQQAKFLNEPNSPYHNTFFMPFSDATNGTDTYHGGRFMDIEYHGEKAIVIDFNYSYNPYCAYNEKYSCPLPPTENKLNFPVRAGERSYTPEKPAQEQTP